MADAIRSALAELVAVQDMKEWLRSNGLNVPGRIDKAIECDKRAPRAWAAAREALAQQPVSGRRICCAANRCAESGATVLGPRHWHVDMREAAFYRFGADYHDRKWEQGFIDFDGVFLNRTEAWKVAEAAGQIVARCGGDDANGGTLYSENLG